MLEMNEGNLHVVICSGSLFSNVIADTLRTYPGIETTCIDPSQVGDIAQVIVLKPDVVIVERGGEDSQFFVALLHQGFRVLCLDMHRSTISVLYEHQRPANSIEDLVNIIGRITEVVE